MLISMECSALVEKCCRQIEEAGQCCGVGMIGCIGLSSVGVSVFFELLPGMITRPVMARLMLFDMLSIILAAVSAS